MGDLVFFVVLSCELLYFSVCHLLNNVDKISDAITVHRIAELDFGIDLISFGHGHVPHVVAEARDLQR